MTPSRLSHIKTLAGLILVTALAAGIGTYTYYMPVKQKERGGFVGISRQAIEQLETLESHMALFEAARPLPADVVRHVTMDLTRLERLVKTSAVQLEHLDALKHDVKTGATAGSVDGRLKEMITEEKASLAVYTAEWEGTAENTRHVLAGSMVLLYLIILVVYVVMRKESELRHQLFAAEKMAANTQRAIAERLSQVVNIQHEIAQERMNLTSVMQVITERTQAISGADGAVVEMVEGEDMLYRAASGTVAPYVGMRIKAQGSLSGLCIALNEVLQCDDSEKDNRVNQEACRKVGLRSMVVLPLTHKEKTVGVLKVTSKRPHAFTKDHISTLMMMASVLSSTINDATAADALMMANDALTEANSMLQELATSDGLTGLKNNRFFQQRLAEEFQRAKRYKSQLSLILLDVDFFKLFNDTYGHVAGDDVLKQVAVILGRMARGTDCVARYGGEEFAIILPQADEGGAVVLAERLRQVIMDTEWAQRPITVSVGVATLHDNVESTLALVEAADQALYHSKEAGRNRVTHIDEMDSDWDPIAAAVAKA